MEEKKRERIQTLMLADIITNTRKDLKSSPTKNVLELIFGSQVSSLSHLLFLSSPFMLHPLVSLHLIIPACFHHTCSILPSPVIIHLLIELVQMDEIQEWHADPVSKRRRKRRVGRERQRRDGNEKMRLI